MLTLDQFQRGGWLLANRYCLCKVEAQTIDHILLHCTKIWVFWQLFFTIVGISWVQSPMVKENLLRWYGYLVGKKCKKVWRVAPLCIFWIIWKERNRRSFDHEDQSDHALKSSFFSNLLFVAEVVYGCRFYAFNQFC